MSLASVKSEIGGELAASSGVSTPGSVGHDIITEQPRSQHTLQADSVDLSGCDLTSAATDGDEEDILSHSSSQFSAVPSDPAMDLNDGTQASSPISDSSQTTTEGPDSAVTPSDSSEIVSGQRVPWFFCLLSLFLDAHTWTLLLIFSVLLHIIVRGPQLRWLTENLALLDVFTVEIA